MHAVEALDDGLLDLFDALSRLAGLRIDAQNCVVVDLRFETLGPASIAAEPSVAVRLVRLVHQGPSSPITHRA